MGTGVPMQQENHTPPILLRTPGDERLHLSLVEFVASDFIPNHVALKGAAGQRHYRAILKHILRPHTVEALFMPEAARAKSRLRALPNWPYVDGVKLSELTPEHVRRLTTAAILQGYSPQTVKHIRNVLGAVIAHAIKAQVFR